MSHRHQKTLILWIVLLSMVLMVHSEDSARSEQLQRADNFICGGSNCVECSPPGYRNAPGVGIDLTMAYGTGAIYYRNGTVRDLIKVDGSWEYQFGMRLLAEDALNVRSGKDSSLAKVSFEDPTWRNPYPLNLYWKYPFAWIYNIRTGIRQMIDDYFYPRPEYSPDALTKAIASMISKIKSQGLDTLEPPLKFKEVYLTLPDFFSGITDIYNTRFQLATHLAGLKLLEGSGTIASTAALMHNGVDWIGPDYPTGDEPSAVLTISYNSASLGATLHIADDDKWLFVGRVVERPIYGVDRRPVLEDEVERYWGEVKEVLKSVIGGEAVDYVLLIGSHAGEEGLLRALEEVLNDSENVAPGVLDSYLSLKPSLEMDDKKALFSAARTAAWLARFRMKDPGCWEPHWCNGDEGKLGSMEEKSEL